MHNKALILRTADTQAVGKHGSVRPRYARGRHCCYKNPTVQFSRKKISVARFSRMPPFQTILSIPSHHLPMPIHQKIYFFFGIVVMRESWCHPAEIPLRTNLVSRCAAASRSRLLFRTAHHQLIDDRIRMRTQNLLLNLINVRDH